MRRVSSRARNGVFIQDFQKYDIKVSLTMAYCWKAQMLI